MPGTDEQRPRRAFLDGSDMLRTDDTPAEQVGRPRRGVIEPESPGKPAEETEETGAKQAEETGTDTTATTDDSVTAEDPTQVTNPFARPGSQQATQPIPVVRSPIQLPSLEEESKAAQAMGKHSAGMTIAPSPPPRRSADSSTTPAEVDTPVPTPVARDNSWFVQRRRDIALFAAGTLLVAVLAGLLTFILSRSIAPQPLASSATVATADPTASEQTTQQSENATADPSEPVAPTDQPPLLTEESLVSLTDAELVVPDVAWAITESQLEPTAERARAACLRADPDAVNPLTSLFRTFGTTDADQLALLHQVDLYANPATAKEVFQTRAADIAACDEVPARIVATMKVTGIGDEASQVTIAYENSPTQFHTVLLVRTGNAVSVIDAARLENPVAAPGLVEGLKRSLNTICTSAEGSCPGTPTATEALPAVVEPAGWLQTADLPRITGGQGQWVAQEVAELSIKGTGCENMTLATQEGPQERQQRTYVLTQDDKAPASFGLDEMLFRFADEEAAEAFATKLTDNIAACPERSLTAKVSTTDPGTAPVGPGKEVTWRTIDLSLAAADDKTVPYQLVVARGGNNVAYLLVTETTDYKFSDEMLQSIARRAAERASQG